MSPDGKIHELLIPANTTATLVAHPVAFDNITDGPFIRFAPTIEEGEQHLCHQYMTDITCKGYPLFTMNFGSALGLKYIHDIWYEGFLVISGGTYVHSRAKVTSVRSSLIDGTNADCAFCLLFQMTTEKETPLLFESDTTDSFSRLTVNSYGYPWVFENSTQYPDCLKLRYKHVEEFARQFDNIYIVVIVDLLEGGTLIVDSFDRNDQPNPQGHHELTDRAEFEILGTSIEFNWCPDDPSQIHGFVADASPAGQTARGNVFCTAGTFNITLREMGPMGLLDGRLIDDLVRKHTRVCVTTEDCQNSTDPRHCQDDLLMDIVQYCEKDNEHAYKYSSQCQTLLPFYFNNRRSTLDEANCTKSTLKQTNRIIQHCQMQVKFPLVIITFAAQNDFPLLLAIRPLKWIDPNVDFRWAMLETLNENPNVDYLLPMIVEPSEKPLWIGFSLNAEETWFTILEKLHSEHNDKNCSYEFWYGAAPNKLTPTTENRRLLTFRDEEPFYEQYLDASIFSVFIPPNCAPTIFFRSNRDLIQGNDTTKRQRICSGIHAFISRHFAGYGREIEEGYFLSRTIYCDSWPVIFVIEIIRLTPSGCLNISYMDKEGQIFSTEEITESISTPINRSNPHAQMIWIKWTPVNPPENIDEGVSLRVYVEKVENKPKTPTVSPVNSDSRKFSYYLLLVLLGFII